MRPGIALGLLIVYLLLSCEVYLAAHTLGKFQISFWKFSPTELRILLAAGNIALFLNPRAGVAASVIRHTRALWNML